MKQAVSDNDYSSFPQLLLMTLVTDNFSAKF